MEQHSKKKSQISPLIVWVLVAVFAAGSFNRMFLGNWKTILTVGDTSVRHSEFLSLQRWFFLQGNHKDGAPPRELYQSIIQSKVMESELNYMGIDCSDRSILRLLKEEMSQGGKISHEVWGEKYAHWRKKLFDFNITEKQFVQHVKRSQKERLLKEALCSQIVVPKGLLEIFLRGLYQKRCISYKIMSFSSDDIKEKPSRQDLLDVMKKDPYRIEQESKRYTLVFLPKPGDIDISEKEIKTFYEKQGFTEPLEEVKDRIKSRIQEEKERTLWEEKRDMLEDSLLGEKDVGFDFEDPSLKDSSPSDPTLNDLKKSMPVSWSHFDKPKNILYEQPVSKFLIFPWMAKVLGIDLKDLSGDLTKKIALVVNKTAEKSVSEPIQTPQGTFWIKVHKVYPEKKVPYTEKDFPLLREKWRILKQKSLAKNKAYDLQRDVLANPSLAQEWDKVMDIGWNQKFPTGSPLHDIPGTFVFKMAKGDVQVIQKGDTFICVRLVNILYNPNDVGEKERKGALMVLRQILQQIFWGAYLGNIQDFYPIDIREKISQGGNEAENFSDLVDE